MMYATAPNSTRIRATPAATASCPTCAERVIPKCGSIVIHHWAHLARVDCDQWAEPESQWHLGWKQRFADAGADVEVTMRRGEQWHRADVIANGWVIELQRSTIPVDQALARETFYGNRMAWVFDMTDPDRWERVHWGRVGFWWKQGAKSHTYLQRPTWWQIPGAQRLIQVRLGLKQRDDGSERVLGKMLRARSVDEFVEAAIAKATTTTIDGAVA